MNRRIAVLLTILFCSCFGSHVRAEVIDKIVALVDGRIITLSDIRKERTIRVVLEDPPISDKELLMDMIDAALLEKEMEQFPGLEVSDDEIEEGMRKIQDLHGLAPSDIRNAIAKGIQRRKYFDLRYRQFIVISNEEVEHEYQTKFVPEAEKKGVPVPDLDQVQAMIRANLIEFKILEEVESSLKSLHERSNFEIL